MTDLNEAGRWKVRFGLLLPDEAYHVKWLQRGGWPLWSDDAAPLQLLL